jgi:hypothetical protein
MWNLWTKLWIAIFHGFSKKIPYFNIFLREFKDPRSSTLDSQNRKKKSIIIVISPLRGRQFFFCKYLPSVFWPKVRKSKNLNIMFFRLFTALNFIYRFYVDYIENLEKYFENIVLSVAYIWPEKCCLYREKWPTYKQRWPKSHCVAYKGPPTVRRLHHLRHLGHYRIRRSHL